MDRKGHQTMDIFKFALQMEKDGAAFYRDMAKKTKHEPVRTVLGMLADEEDKHYRAIQAIQKADYDMTETEILDSARNIFQRVRDFGDDFADEADQIKLYEQALDLEHKSEAFYLDRADQVKLPRQKDLFKKLAAEEAKHVVLLENLAEFAARPQQWLENAEFFHPEDY
jgi:rubrerythrin